jgi:tetratricopeptide (TPR) repeat protein
MDKDTFQSIVAAFQSVFPEMTLWKSLKGDCMMVGARQKGMIDLATLENRFSQPAIQKDLQRIQIGTLSDFLGHMLTGSRGSADLCQGARIHTDDNLLAEYAAPRALMGGNILKTPLINSLEKVRQADFSFITNPPEASDILARAADQVNARGEVYKYFSKKRNQGVEDLTILQAAANLNPDDSLLHEAVDRFRARAFNSFKNNQIKAAVKAYEEILTILPKDAKANYNLATLLRQSGRIEKAFDHYSRAAESDPEYFQAHFNLAQIYAMKQEASKARQHYGQVLKIKPDFYPAMIGLADLLLASFASEPDSPAKALELADKAADLTGHQDLRVLLSLSTAQKNAGQINPAMETLQKGLDLSNKKKDMNAIRTFRERLSNFKLAN